MERDFFFKYGCFPLSVGFVSLVAWLVRKEGRRWMEKILCERTIAACCELSGLGLPLCSAVDLSLGLRTCTARC